MSSDTRSSPSGSNKIDRVKQRQAYPTVQACWVCLCVCSSVTVSEHCLIGISVHVCFCQSNPDSKLLMCSVSLSSRYVFSVSISIKVMLRHPLWPSLFLISRHLPCVCFLSLSLSLTVSMLPHSVYWFVCCCLFCSSCKMVISNH